MIPIFCRTCVNGRPIASATQLRHGDRILWGNNHYFRINIPKVMRRMTPAPVVSAEGEEHNNSMGKRFLINKHFVGF